jgi:elongation factor P
MPSASELKNGSIVEIDGEPHAVERLQVQTPSARGGATLYKIRFRNLVSKRKTDRACKGDERFGDANFQRHEAQFLYRQGETFSFMDLTDYSQFTLEAGELDEVADYLTENLEGITALISDERILGVEPPPVVELEIVETAPSVHGASVTARTKAATLTTGLVVQVPEYLESGERVRVDTRTARYLARA